MIYGIMLNLGGSFKFKYYLILVSPSSLYPCSDSRAAVKIAVKNAPHTINIKNASISLPPSVLSYILYYI